MIRPRFATPPFEQFLQERGVTPEDAKKIHDRAFDAHSTLKSNETVRVKKVRQFHKFTVQVRKDNISVYDESHDEGTFSTVHLLANFTLGGAPATSPRIAKRKKGGSYDAVVYWTRDFSPTHLDVPLRVTSVECVSQSEHKRYDGNWNQIKWGELNNPVVNLVQILYGAAMGLHKMHQKDKIHRDLKGINLLFKWDPETQKMQGVISDFDTICFTPKRWHRTQGTPPYLDPMDFGKPGDSPRNQSLRNGKQSKSGDVYGLSRTLERDGLYNLIIKIAEKQKCSEAIDAILDPAFSNRNDPVNNTKTLEQIGKEHPFLCHILANSRLFILSPLEERKKALHDAIDALTIPNSQILHTLVELMGKMQRIENRLNTEEICRELGELLAPYQGEEENEPPSSSISKSEKQVFHTETVEDQISTELAPMRTAKLGCKETLPKSPLRKIQTI